MHKVEESDKVLKGMKTISLYETKWLLPKNLEIQMGHISAHLNPWQKRGLPSDTIANPKGDNAQCMDFTTLSGKIICDKAFKGIGSNSRKEKTIVFQSDKLVEEFNNDVKC